MDCLLPYAGIPYATMVAQSTRDFNTGRRDVGQIILTKRWQSDLVERMHLKILLWHVPRQMGTKDSARQKKRFTMFTLQLFDAVIHGVIIVDDIIATFQLGPLQPADGLLGNSNVSFVFSSVIIFLYALSAYCGG